MERLLTVSRCNLELTILAHFCLLIFLLKSGKLGEGARIVVVSSEAHHLSPVNIEDCGFGVSSNYVPLETSLIIAGLGGGNL